MITTTLTDFRKEMKQYLDKITDDNETLIINRGKDKGVVMLSMDEYNQLEKNVNSIRRYEDLSDAERASIERGIQAADEGRTKPHSEVMQRFRKYVSDRVD